VHPYRLGVCVLAHDGRSAEPQAQALTVSGVTGHALRRAPSLAYVSSGEELTIDFRLLLHCSRIRCVMLGNESIPVCECEISTSSGNTRAFVTTYRCPSHLETQSVYGHRVSIHSKKRGSNLLAIFSSGRLYMRSQ
jgi:hypothetical protein